MSKGRLSVVVAPVVVGVAGLAAWEAVVTLGRVAPFVLPAPSVIAEQFWKALQYPGVLK